MNPNFRLYGERALVTRTGWGSHGSMIPVNPSSFGRLTYARRRYPGGAEKLSIFFTLSRATPECRAATHSLIPSRDARRTFQYSSTVKMPPHTFFRLQITVVIQRLTTVGILRRPDQDHPRGSVAGYAGALAPPRALVRRDIQRPR
jgi:hypothetical protein